MCGAWRAGVARREAARHSSLVQLAAWGAPAALAAAVLVTRDVDADELTGTCFVGNQSTKSLLALVIIPHSVCLIIGVIFLLSGIRILLSSPCRAPAPPNIAALAPLAAHPTAQHRKDPIQDQNLLRLGIFAVLYTIPLTTIIATWIYEYIWRDEWLAAPNPSPVPIQQPKPAVWVFLLRIFMCQILGVMTAVWVMSPKAKQVWRRLFRRLGPQAYKPTPVKCVAPPVAIHCYAPPHAHPKRGTSHVHKYSTYSHGGSYRKPRSHHTHTLTISGGETIL